MNSRLNNTNIIVIELILQPFAVQIYSPKSQRCYVQAGKVLKNHRQLLSLLVVDISTEVCT